jgi:ABC-type multidrug transport system ATPase subunit
MSAAIEVTDLRKQFADVKALRGITFSVQKGVLYGIIGADGAGKTTLMRICTTLINADSGKASFFDKDVSKDIQYIRSRIGYMPQRFSLYQDLSVKENLLFFADIYGVKQKERKERLDRLLSFSRLGPFQKRRAAHLSGGMKQKLALCCALIHTPEVLILDEPTTGVDPVSRNEFWEILRDLRQQGITIIVSTPYMEEASLCDELLVLHKGEILLNGTPSHLLNSYPHSIFRIGNSKGSTSFKSPPELPKGILLMYPSAGMMHVVVENRQFSLSLIHISEPTRRS